MHTTEEVSLVEFYKAGLRLAEDDGYKLVFCLVAREADVPTVFDEVAQKWHSLDPQ